MAWEGINDQIASSNPNRSAHFLKILTVKTPQAHDKLAHRSHHVPDMGKHNVFRAQVLEHSKTCVLDRSRIEVGLLGGALLAAR